MKADKLPTFTLLVQRALEGADDFLTLAQLKASVPDLNSNRATASLAHLYKRRVVGFMVEDGVTYWYATPDTDTRAFFIEEKVREEPGTRKPRRTVRPPLRLEKF